MAKGHNSNFSFSHINAFANYQVFFPLLSVLVSLQRLLQLTSDTIIAR